MFRRTLVAAAVAALAAGVSAYAANPFSDVSTSDWAYQAVSQLSDQGIVEGYPDGTFRGQRNITRYELAQIIARLMANEDQFNAEQRATIDKLAGEYADELDNLGVRVSNLENKLVLPSALYSSFHFIRASPDQEMLPTLASRLDTRTPRLSSSSAYSPASLSMVALCSALN